MKIKKQRYCHKLWKKKEENLVMQMFVAWMEVLRREKYFLGYGKQIEIGYSDIKMFLWYVLILKIHIGQRLKKKCLKCDAR